MTACERLQEPVVVDGQFVTSQGPGTCFGFALELLKQIDGAETAATVARAMVLESGGRI